jgi:hypothetical protein
MKTDMNMTIEGITLSELRTVSPDEDAKKEGIKKTITLRIKYDGLTLKDVFAKAFKSDVVSWQNGGAGRKNYDNIVDKSVIEISAKAPGAGPQENPMDAMIREARAAGVDPKDEKAFAAYIIAEMKKR